MPKQPTNALLTENAFIELRRAQPDHLPSATIGPTIEAATVDLWTPAMQKGSEFQKSKAVLAATETVKQGGASPEDAAAPAETINEFEKNESKLKRRRLLD